MADCLVAYESVFEEIFDDLYPNESIPRRLVIDFGWHRSLDEVDAQAIQGGLLGRPAVRMTVAWFGALQRLANAVFSSRDQMAHIGQISPDGPLFADIIDGSIEVPESDAPPDPVRHEAASLVTELAIAMVTLHEIGHHALGHLGAGATGFSSPLRLHERVAQIQQHPEDEAMRLQNRELEADAFSFPRVIGLAARGISPFRKQLVGNGLRPHMLDLAVLGYNLVIALLHLNRFSFSDYERAAHPHPAIRILASQREVATRFQDDPALVAKYLSGWRTSLAVMIHNEDQRDTLAMLVHQRPVLERQLDRLLEAKDQAGGKNYDFSLGQWIDR